VALHVRKITSCNYENFHELRIHYETGYTRHNKCLRNTEQIKITILPKTWLTHNKKCMYKPRPFIIQADYHRIGKETKSIMIQWNQLRTLNHKMAYTQERNVTDKYLAV
jgi:hypothetical protein